MKACCTSVYDDGKKFQPLEKSCVWLRKSKFILVQEFEQIRSNKEKCVVILCPLEYVLSLATEFNNYPCSSKYCKIIQLMNSEESII